MKKIARWPALSLILISLAVGSAFSQTAPARRGTVERIKVHGKALEGNLEGDSPDRDVSVYLPPSYKTDSKRRYPVVYFLHGFTDSDDKWYGFTKHWINLPEVVDQALADPNLREMILVTPNAFTRYQGSMYSNSVTTGNWEEYVAKELVGYIDSHYRTLARPESRGLAGHSMGGYGSMRIGQKYPDIFSSVYLLSPCCLTPNMNAPQNPAAMAKLEAVKTPEDIEKADFMTKAAFASAAAWSPNPSNGPFFLDLPVKDGQPQPMVTAKWAANAPLAAIDQNIGNLRKLHAIAFDAGDRDAGIAASIKVLDRVLNEYRVQHTYEEYEGDHINRIADRISRKMLQFFTQHLAAEPKRK
ncbi:alpha/beta hydrolase [Larkinella soli]|uniref:alpha/beta hydrolase n=1 Tax=Larkinella soli TaxID=1770527 RepID=UPI000FFBC6D9|nr:alpha/beta hydrolase-fold protein [Larkinella soli]